MDMTDAQSYWMFAAYFQVLLERGCKIDKISAMVFVWHKHLRNRG